MIRSVHFSKQFMVVTPSVTFQHSWNLGNRSLILRPLPFISVLYARKWEAWYLISCVWHHNDVMTEAEQAKVTRSWLLWAKYTLCLFNLHFIETLKDHTWFEALEPYPWSIVSRIAQKPWDGGLAYPQLRSLWSTSGPPAFLVCNVEKAGSGLGQARKQ